jgi:hypothetical protein
VPAVIPAGKPQQLQKTKQQQVQYDSKLVEAADTDNIAARPAVTKPFNEVVPEIQELIVTMLGIYSAQTQAELSKVMNRNCVVHSKMTLHACLVSKTTTYIDSYYRACFSINATTPPST